MKMNLRGLTLTAALLSASNVAFADEGRVSSIGDLPGYGEDAYFADEAHYNQPAAYAQPAMRAQPAQHVEREIYAPQAHAAPQYAPVGASELQAVSHHDYGCASGNCGGCDSCSGGCDSGCDGGCDGGCDSACSSGRCRTLSLDIGKWMGMCDPDTWAQTEFLMWFVQDREMAPLASVAGPGQDPVGANSRVVFGDDINGELSAGFRTDYGRYISDNVGVGGRFWMLANNNDSYFGGGNGTQFSLARPYFNTDTSAIDGLFVSANNVFGANVVGNLAIDDSIELMGGEIYSRVNFGCGRDCKLELIGGYSHLEIDNDLVASSTAIVNNTTQFDFRDRIATENRFDGGQVGFEMSIKRGKWMARSLTKVHLGNMEQSVSIAGQTSVVPAGTTPVFENGGALALDNIGNNKRDVFAFVPEANFKLGYRFRDHVMLSVGYSFLYIDNVALAGDFVNPVFDGTTVGSGGPFGGLPFDFEDSSLFVQGIDLGVIIGF